MRALFRRRARGHAFALGVRGLAARPPWGSRSRRGRADPVDRRDPPARASGTGALPDEARRRPAGIGDPPLPALAAATAVGPFSHETHAPRISVGGAATAPAAHPASRQATGLAARPRPKTPPAAHPASMQPTGVNAGPRPQVAPAAVPRARAGIERSAGIPERARRWRRAASAAGLDRPAPWPGWIRPLVRVVAGTRTAPQLTHGPRTARALSASGTRAAAWAGAVHLARAPAETAQDLEVVAHELSHVVDGVDGVAGVAGIDGVATPRFFDGGQSEPGEPRARGIGRAVGAFARGAAPHRPGLAVRVARMLAGGRPSKRFDEAGASHGHPDAGAGAEPPVTTRWQGTPSRVPPGMPRGATIFRRPAAGRSAGPDRSRPARRPAPATPGVSALPVGGTLTVMRSPAETSVARAPGARRIAVPDLAGATSSAPRGGRASAATPGGTTSSAAGAATGALTGALGSAAGAAVDPASQLGDLLEALEERVLVELERRGGRYAGAF